MKELLKSASHGLALPEDNLEMAPGLVSGENTVEDTAGINTWVTKNVW